MKLKGAAGKEKEAEQPLFLKEERAPGCYMLLHSFAAVAAVNTKRAHAHPHSRVAVQ